MNGGVVVLHAFCCACEQPMTCNPHHVPSIRIDGAREPVCRSCMAIANAERERRGLEPHPIHPEAYEPLPEEGL